MAHRGSVFVTLVLCLFPAGISSVTGFDLGKAHNDATLSSPAEVRPISEVGMQNEPENLNGTSSTVGIRRNIEIGGLKKKRSIGLIPTLIGVLDKYRNDVAVPAIEMHQKNQKPIPKPTDTVGEAIIDTGKAYINYIIFGLPSPKGRENGGEELARKIHKLGAILDRLGR